MIEPIKEIKCKVIRPEPITNDHLDIMELIKGFSESIDESRKIQERIDNLNISPLQQRINKIRKIADDSKERIDNTEYEMGKIGRMDNSPYSYLGNIGIQIRL